MATPYTMKHYSLIFNSGVWVKSGTGLSGIGIAYFDLLEDLPKLSKKRRFYKNIFPFHHPCSMMAPFFL